VVVLILTYAGAFAAAGMKARICETISRMYRAGSKWIAAAQKEPFPTMPQVNAGPSEHPDKPHTGFGISNLRKDKTRTNHMHGQSTCGIGNAAMAFTSRIARAKQTARRGFTDAHR
jgi:hypothetical protein